MLKKNSTCQIFYLHVININPHSSERLKFHQGIIWPFNAMVGLSFLHQFNDLKPDLQQLCSSSKAQALKKKTESRK